VTERYPDAERRWFAAEQPRRSVDVGGFRIDATPVTNERFARFLTDGGYRRPELWDPFGWRWRVREDITGPRFWDLPGWGAWQEEDRPVVGVSWYEADAYARWSGGRLPGEHEWERAAGGGDGRRFPWGNDFSPHLANTAERLLGRTTIGFAEWQREFLDRRPWRAGCLTTPVGAHPDGASPFGLLDCAGNVWEWCATPYWGGEYGALPGRVCRGGSYAYPAWAARTTDRGHHPSWWRGLGNGFRCAYELGGHTTAKGQG
jgi:iron(II)-dependent oxidoreductase